MQFLYDSNDLIFLKINYCVEIGAASPEIASNWFERLPQAYSLYANNPALLK